MRLYSLGGESNAIVFWLVSPVVSYVNVLFSVLRKTKVVLVGVVSLEVAVVVLGQHAALTAVRHQVGVICRRHVGSPVLKGHAGRLDVLLLKLVDVVALRAKVAPDELGYPAGVSHEIAASA